MRSGIQKTAVAVTALVMTGCSLFGPRMQTVTVSSDPTGAKVLINGESIGNSPLRHQVHRSDDLLVEVRAPGFQHGYRTSHRGLSTLGLVDLVGGCIILFPFFGLLSPAAWEHEPSSFGITLDPVEAAQAAPTTPAPAIPN